MPFASILCLAHLHCAMPCASILCLVTQTGHLVHIDFGHILGHVKTFMGVNRDKSPFILTDDFLVIMGGKEGKKSKNFKK